jgi:hypothetical protein
MIIIKIEEIDPSVQLLTFLIFFLFIRIFRYPIVKLMYKTIINDSQKAYYIKLIIVVIIILPITINLYIQYSSYLIILVCLLVLLVISLIFSIYTIFIIIISILVIGLNYHFYNSLFYIINIICINKIQFQYFILFILFYLYYFLILNVIVYNLYLIFNSIKIKNVSKKVDLGILAVILYGCTQHHNIASLHYNKIPKFKIPSFPDKIKDKFINNKILVKEYIKCKKYNVDTSILSLEYKNKLRYLKKTKIKAYINLQYYNIIGTLFKTFELTLNSSCIDEQINQVYICKTIKKYQAINKYLLQKNIYIKKNRYLLQKNIRIKKYCNLLKACNQAYNYQTFILNNNIISNKDLIKDIEINSLFTIIILMITTLSKSTIKNFITIENITVIQMLKKQDEELLKVPISMRPFILTNINKFVDAKFKNFFEKQKYLFLLNNKILKKIENIISKGNYKIKSVIFKELPSFTLQHNNEKYFKTYFLNTKLYLDPNIIWFLSISKLKDRLFISKYYRHNLYLKYFVIPFCYLMRKMYFEKFKTSYSLHLYESNNFKFIKYINKQYRNFFFDKSIVKFEWKGNLSAIERDIHRIEIENKKIENKKIENKKIENKKIVK